MKRRFLFCSKLIFVLIVKKYKEKLHMWILHRKNELLNSVKLSLCLTN
jgi:hypothetical protein